DDDQERAGEPKLVAEHREDRVGVRSGEIAELLAPRPEALTEEPTEREPVERLDRLEAGALRIGPRIEERRQTLQAVGLLDRDQQHRDADERGHRAEDAEPGP